MLWQWRQDSQGSSKSNLTGQTLALEINMANSEMGTDWNNGGMNEKASKATDAIGDAASQVKEKAAQLGRTAVRKVDETRGSTAEALQSTANSLRSGAQSSGEAISNAANRTAEKLESTAKYVREHDFRGMMQDVEEVVRRNPSQSLVAAIAMGFLMGSALRRS
jgi:ElaB/YqjD/DUF883 family membrane-anchored ribosome-binding protein